MVPGSGPVFAQISFLYVILWLSYVFLVVNFYFYSIVFLVSMVHLCIVHLSMILFRMLFKYCVLFSVT